MIEYLCGKYVLFRQICIVQASQLILILQMIIAKYSCSTVIPKKQANMMYEYISFIVRVLNLVMTNIEQMHVVIYKRSNISNQN